MKYFITGATGFVGRHLIKKLSNTDAEITVLLRSNSKQEFGNNIQSVAADITSASQITTLMTGHDIVIHLAYGSHGTPTEQYRVTVEGTKSVLNAAINSKVKRFIHVSTTSVYGDPPEDITYTEESPRGLSSSLYCKAKQEAESFVLTKPTQGTEVVVLQPSIIYGPGGGYWTQGILGTLSQNKMFPLIDKGRGFANLVHVYDVVDAILKSTAAPGINRQCFILTNDEKVTWAQFLGAYEKILNKKCLVSVPSQLMKERHHYIGKSRRSITAKFVNLAYRGLFGLLQFPYFWRSLHLLEENRVNFFTAKPLYSNQKARMKLGFSPEINFETGVRMVLDWKNG